MSDNESSALSCEGIDGSERQSISDNDDVFDDIDNSNDFAVDKENSNENANVDYNDDTDNYRFRQNSMNDPNGSPFDSAMDFDDIGGPQEQTEQQYCIISIDSLKYGDYRISDDKHVVRVTHKEIDIDAVTFHPNSLQIEFHCLNEQDPILRKYRIDKAVLVVWHAELGGEIVTDECEMRSSNREFVLKKRYPSKWQSNNDLLFCGITGDTTSQRNSYSTYGYHSYSSNNNNNNNKPSSYSSLNSPSTMSTLPKSYRYTKPSPISDSSSSHPSNIQNNNHSNSTLGTSTSSSTLNNASSYHYYPYSSYSSIRRYEYSPRNYSNDSNNNSQPQHSPITTRSRSISSLNRRSSSSSNVITIPPLSSAMKASPISNNNNHDSSDISMNSSSVISPATSHSKPPAIPLMSPATVRPTAKVLPYEEKGTIVELGYTGLRNIGNTCFMNATLQMLVNCKELQLFFTGDYYKKDVNKTNPLGFGGRLAEAFAEFMKQMWSGMNGAIEPTKIKELVAEKAPQFANFAQHDAHEFLSFLIDGLHEDLNRVKTKPYTSTVEANGRADIEVSNEAWKNYLLRNDSLFVDLFHGQLKSRLQCPQCHQVSITFDPFLYLAVPFPKEKRSSSIYFWPIDTCLKPVKFTIRYSADGKVSEMLDAVSQLVKVPSKQLRMIEVCNHRITRISQPNLSSDALHDTLHVFQVHDESDCHEETVELIVVQRLLYRKTLLRQCANCLQNNDQLKCCERCYDAFYCNKDCQIEHWNKDHKTKCKLRAQAEAVGEPFIISLPKSKATYANIIRYLECRCRYSVNVFQPPVDNSTSSSNNDTILSDSSDISTNSNTSSQSTSSKAVNVNVPSSTTPNSCNSTKANKRQMVLGEPRNKTNLDSKLFIVRRLQQLDYVIGDTIVDTNEPLNLPSGTFLSINWYNMKSGKDYLTVESKEDLDINIEESSKYQKKQSMNVSNNWSASNPSLYDMLSMFSETERLKPEESWYCNKCKDHVEATKRLQLYRLPPIMIIQLKRFVYTTSIMSMHRRSKDDRAVKYPVAELDLAQFLADSAPQSQETKYDLTGVVCHSGSSYFGHYVSMGRLESLDGKCTEIDWRNFDDSIVSRIGQSRVQNDDAYLLFYKQRGDQTEHLLKNRYSIRAKH